MRSEKLDKLTLIERSIIKKYRKRIWKPFLTAVNEYHLIEEGDKIAVCISGGKDSFLLAKCLEELKKHGRFDFELVYLVMDPGYNQKNREMIHENAEILGIEIDVFESNIFEVVSEDNDAPCYMCARMRRGYLYKNAKLRGCNKIALGHHFDDIVETILMSMFYVGEVRTMMPKLHSKNFTGMELIRPLCVVKEKDVIAWSRYNDLEFIRCACKLTEKEGSGEMYSKRSEMKELVEQLRKTSPYIDKNIFKSVENVHLDAIVGYKKANGERYSFLDDYDDYVFSGRGD